MENKNRNTCSNRHCYWGETDWDKNRSLLYCTSL